MTSVRPPTGRTATAFAVVLLTAAGLLAGAVVADTVAVDFEGFQEGTGLTTQYERVGVVFEAAEGESAGAVVRTCDDRDGYCTSARSGKNAVITPPDGEFRRHPLVVTFEEPRETVRLYVREAAWTSDPQTARLVARTESGGFVDESSVEFDPGTGWHRIEVSARSATIAEVTLTSAYTDSPEFRHNYFVVDDLSAHVNEPPTAAFGHSPTDPVSDEPVEFDASNASDADGRIVEYRWDFDGDQSVDAVSRTETTTHSFPEPGPYRVTLFVVDDDGAVDSHLRTVTVVAAPVARCSIPDSRVAPDETVLVDASGSDADLVHFDVDGDGTFDRTNGEDFRETVSYSGSAEVTPVVRAELGGRNASRSCPTVLVNERPTAVVSVPSGAPTVGVPVRFDASASSDPDGDIVRYSWDLDGDGDPDHSGAAASVTHTFGEPGPHTVSLAVVDGDGATGRAEATVVVNDPPTAVLDGPHATTTDIPVTFDASASSDSDGDIVRYSWDLDGDGTPDRNTTEPTTAYTFRVGGPHEVTLTVLDDDGAVGRAGASVEVNGRATVAFEPTPAHPTVGDEVTFDASESSDPDGRIVEYRWDLDGDGTLDRNTTGPTVAYAFEAGGAHDVSLVVVDDDGATARTEATVVVNARPTAAFDPLVDPPTVDEEVTFDASGSTDRDGEIVLYSWDLDGDGDPDRNTSEPVGRRTFEESGEHTVSLVVVDDDGATARTGATVVVNDPPTAVLADPPEDLRAGEPFTFDASGSTDRDGEIVLYSWDLDGDGDPDRNTTVPTVTYTFEEPGTYDLSLAVVDDAGVVRRTGASVPVRPPVPPGTDLAVGGAVGLAGALTLRFVRRPPRVSGVPSGGNSRVDGSDTGKTEEGERQRDRSPRAVMWYWPSEPVAPCPVVFDGSLSSGGAGGGVTSYRWTIDGDSTEGQRVVWLFEEAGDYEAELLVEDGANGRGRVERSVAVEEREGDLELDAVGPAATTVERQAAPDHEHVVFRNTGDGRLHVGGWTVHDVLEEETGRIAEGEHVFEFPDGVVIDPGETVTLHTGPAPEGDTELDGPEGSRHLFWGERRPVWNRETDVVVVEDDGGRPVAAVRYERRADGDYAFEDLDVEVLEDWFPTVVLSRREGVSPIRVSVGPEALVGALASAAGFAAGASLLRGPWTFLRNWALLAEFLFMSSATWLVATAYGGLPPSVDLQVPWLPPEASPGLLLAAVVLLRAGLSLRDRPGSRAS